MDVKEIYDAKERLKGHIKETPIVYAPNLGEDVYLKVEVLQDTGSFKLRGAYNKIATLTDEEAEKGVVACSAGNHAQGVAKSATERGIRSIICMPFHAPLSKVQATKNYGAEVELVKDSFDDAAAYAAKLSKEEGLTFVAPFDDEKVIAGQGTIGLEILEKLPDTDIIVVPIGGGGLISGIAVAAKSINPNIKIIGVQTKISPSMYESIKEGKIITVKGGSTIADGIAVKTPGKLTFDLVKEYVDDIVLVTEGEISSAILTLLEKNKIITEGAAASTVAALMYKKFSHKGKKVCCVLSGGNIDVTRVSKVIEKGLFKTNRRMELKIKLNDQPGEMTKMAKLFEREGANIVKIGQNIDVVGDTIDSMIVSVVVDTKDKAHQEQIITELNQNFYVFKANYNDTQF
ncbi:threonine ammonia-lyase [Peptoniphilus gorbachii]|uniref:L-threonine dehydratase catabolic TdcB n=1 Tax=Peptoniphilus gorbachii TaxID=411567 RepID=A0ABS2MKA8_9FIRM|nr:threonine ammonia-lyase [Peptoniphilus gorbachii]MBS6719837.1 threonine ammonia-lyase [Peptoniphilus harei]MBM7550455.1 threonine dehydratase [Peptoniphilus gorbachii]MDU1022473.1 threonine ammonia-lyase [Peptoniphilus harei]MDU5466934.1 threonine ammonia-lyase [Peptoniphilus harei]MDU5570892.1 threonine ammonia-lyase [Peptoniphilus harei]